jgi:hypothetical protein
MQITKTTEQQDFGGIFGPFKRFGWCLLEMMQMDAVFEANMSEDTIDRHRPDI